MICQLKSTINIVRVGIFCCCRASLKIQVVTLKDNKDKYFLHKILKMNRLIRTLVFENLINLKTASQQQIAGQHLLVNDLCAL